MKIRVGVIGGGITGLATAFKLLKKRADRIELSLMEKEREVGLHQSSHNSGVLHAGLAYAPHSAKAQLARSGIRQMIAFCREHDIPHEQCGKLVLATDSQEVEELEKLRTNGLRNGLIGLRILDREEYLEKEPYAGGVKALLVPEEGIVDFKGVCDGLRREIEALGGHVVSGFKFTAVEQRGGEQRLQSSKGEEVAVDYTINCGGLYADRIAHLFGVHPAVRIVPFRGDFYRFKASSDRLVNDLIYPLADPRYPFLGVHLTRLITGEKEAGPNAVLAFSREGYNWWDIHPGELGSALSYKGFRRFVKKHPYMVASELQSTLWKSHFVKRLKPLLPEIEERDLEKSRSGVRAQAMDKKGNLAGDFELMQGEHSTHLINAPSPAATASLAIGDWISDKVLSYLD